ncbi:IS66 family transposase [Hydrogenophaga sp. PBL-H3]|uniref:IS66 family transposase n=1 Tax=Hydrogenophaga sp. PBL-H3 TaxID=434010 RepID=UPI0013204A06|nr:IS66 family transposase [Hydrogenophaga sp. PBL-H3]QHE76140.1 IS66 family transposase [Hydrogenophaga sp. PBL-H3]QHE80564.1 IS66 family transposase [Hydrogenophaga sp. PBL-H3]
MITADHLDTLEPQQMRAALLSLMSELAERDGVIERQGQEVVFKQALIDKLTHENALLKRMKFAAQSERFSAEQKSLLDESLDEDLQAVADEIEQATPPVACRQDKQVPKRAPLPANLPRREIRHEPESTTCHTPGCGCQMKRIGEEVAEKLDYVPGVFTVERHIRGKWACAQCQTLVQVPVAPHVIDKGIPTTGLLAQVLVAKYADHLPLYRQEAIFGRAGLAIPRSTLAQWVGSCGVQLQPLVDALRNELLQQRVLHADETPVAMLKPGNGKTHRAYLWAYATGAFEHTRAVVYDFCESRAGEHARNFLGTWKGSLVCDDFSGYKALLAAGVTEVGCLAHARRKFFDLHAANQSQIAQRALEQLARIYEIEREVKEISAEQRLAVRQERTKPAMDALHEWMTLQRRKVPDGSATAKALDYSLKRWAALIRFADDGQLPVDNNWIENQIRPIAIGRNNWLFAGSLRAGQRAAAVMSLIQTARMNGHDPYAYLRDVMARLPMHRASRIDELLPHRWQLHSPIQ